MRLEDNFYIPEPWNITRGILIWPQEHTVNRSRIPESVYKPKGNSSLFSRVADGIGYPHEYQWGSPIDAPKCKGGENV
jgi:hypothetical protein